LQNDAVEPLAKTPIRIHPRAVAVVISCCVLMLAAVVIVSLQSFTTSDTRCNGTLLRLIEGGGLTNPDGVCAHAENVRFAWSMAVFGTACGLVWLTVRAAGRRSA
jgi:hypothetical protein